MSVQSQINRIKSAKDSLRSVLTDNGATVPFGTTIDKYPQLFADILQNGSTYLYKATFLVDRWSGSGTYTQTATVTPLAGAPAITSDFVMASAIFVEDTYSDSTQETIEESGGVVNRSQKVIGNGAFTCTTRGGEKPTSDVEVFFLAKKEA
ncbi:hypothetical protein [uncultured Subdoligranulum sp.]|uniref:hypothetical protein n=1 Tax=uncultured Subdoligranulum sp. TaxID=512298 RepID=UPI0026367DF3|nr:hypothetical protein [uncultured Subdoligranulum sp.]